MKHSTKIGLPAIALMLLALMAAGIVFLSDRSSDLLGIQSVGPVHMAGPFQVQLGIDPEKPRIGKNQLTLIIQNKDDQPVEDANVSATAEMPAMGAMPAPVEIKPGGAGLYQGQFELPMDGAWPLTVKIQSATQGQAKLTFEMATSRKGLKLNTSTPSSIQSENPLEANVAPPPK